MSGSRRPFRALALALAASWALVPGCRQGGSTGEKLSESARAPNFELKDLSGKLARLSDFQGKVVLLDFWATYCIPCHESIPAFQGLYERYRAQGFEVVGVSLDVLTEHVPAFVREHKVSYTVLLDPENSTIGPYGVRGLPMTFLIDKNGDIRRQWIGFDETVISEMQASIRELLERPPS